MGIQIGKVSPGQVRVAMLSALFVACWSSGFIGAKLGAADAPITTVLMWRFVPLAAVLVPLAHRFHRDRRIPGLGHRILLRHIVIGVLSQTGYLTTVYWAIARGVNTGTTALIDGLQPLAAAALVGPLLGVAVTGRQWAGLGLGVCGVVLVTASDAANASGVPWWAYLIPLIGMLSLIAATLVERRTPDRIPPPTSLTIQCCTSAAIFTGAALLTGTATPPAAGTFWLALAWLILLSTLGGYGLYWYLVAKLGVTQVNALMFLMAPVTAVWGALLFGESFTGVTAAGLAIGIAAVITVNYSGSKSPAAERSAATGTGSVEVAACR